MDARLDGFYYDLEGASIAESCYLIHPHGWLTTLITSRKLILRLQQLGWGLGASSRLRGNRKTRGLYSTNRKIGEIRSTLPDMPRERPRNARGAAPAAKFSPDAPEARDEGPRLIPLAPRPPAIDNSWGSHALELADIALGHISTSRKKPKR